MSELFHPCLPTREPTMSWARPHSLRSKLLYNKSQCNRPQSGGIQGESLDLCKEAQPLISSKAVKWGGTEYNGEE